MKLLLEQWRSYSKHLLLESQATSTLDDLLSATHASGRPIPPQLAGAGTLGESEGLQLANEIAVSLENHGIRQTLVDAGSWEGGAKSDRVLSDEEKKRLENIKAMIQLSIELFTGATVSTVREPENFEPTRDKMFDDTVKVDYEVAKIILSAIANGPYGIYADSISSPVYRGIALPVAAARALKVGDVFGRDLSSWTRVRSQAIKFTRDPSNANKDHNRLLGTLSVIFEIKKPKRGGQIYSYSEYYNEMEVIRSGQVRITKITEGKGRVSIIYECEEI